MGVILLATDVKDLLKRLEDGVSEIQGSEQWRRLLKAQAKFHGYSFGNLCLIMSQTGGRATRVCGFNSWIALGRSVKKGEHGIAILAPVFPRKGEDRHDLDQNHALSQAPGEDSKKGAPVHFRVAYVFDWAQTEGKPLPEHPTHDLTGNSQQAKLLLGRLVLAAEEEGLRVRYEDPAKMGGAKGYYQRGTKSIVLAKGLALDQASKTLVHELAHSVCGHGMPGAERDRSTEEAEAEGTAFVVCEHFGIDTSNYTFGYVADWSGEEGPKVIKRVGAAVQKAARTIIELVEPQPVREQEIQWVRSQEPELATGRGR